MKQLEFAKVKGWGGKRKGAGRKNRSGKVSHGKRPTVDFKKPLHITWKMKSGCASLRQMSLLKSFRKCAKAAKRFDFGVVHFSLQGDHIHMFIEAKDNASLASGMKSLGCSFGKAVRQQTGGAGGVFNGRYHIHVLKTPREVKNALRYVILNTSKHTKLIPHLDHFSSARHFREWRALIGVEAELVESYLINDDLPEYLSPPRSWLAREGWRRAG